MTGILPEIVLVVDDDDAKRHSIAKILRRGDYLIREVATGGDALRLAAEKPDLIVLDVKLPDISGFEVCRRIKDDRATASIPVLLISSTFVDIEDRVHGLEGGADGYLTDVLEPLELLATVRALLRARKAEEAVQNSSRHWQITFDAISDGVILLGLEGQVVQVNAAIEAILGRSWTDLVGRPIAEVLGLPPGGPASPFTRMIESGRREIVERALNGRWLRVTIDAIHDADAVPKGGVCIVSDITDRKTMEDELKRRAEDLATADRRKDEFLAMLAHELRNPLAPIRNALEAIRLDRDDPAATDEAIEIASRQVGHMAHLLDDLLDVSRFTRGNPQIRAEMVDLGAVLRHAIEVAAPLIAARRHVLTSTLPKAPVWVEGDPTRLAQVISNLLNNAAKYTDPGGAIMLRAEVVDGEVVVRVRDDGIGLSAEMLSRVFDLFAQETRSVDRSQGGLGIGLTLVRSLVQLHGGSVTATSEGQGRGSEFVVRLPISTRAVTPDFEDGPEAHAAGEGRLRVLVVDDSVDSARSLARVIKLWGHEVRLAYDGPSAVSAASADAFDAIILDIGLPGMDGLQVATAIRARPTQVRPLLVALTGYGQEEDHLRSREAGFDHHLVKPVNLDDIREILSGCTSAAHPGDGPAASHP